MYQHSWKPLWIISMLRFLQCAKFYFLNFKLSFAGWIHHTFGYSCLFQCCQIQYVNYYTCCMDFFVEYKQYWMQHILKTFNPEAVLTREKTFKKSVVLYGAFSHLCTQMVWTGIIANNRFFKFKTFVASSYETLPTKVWMQPKSENTFTEDKVLYDHSIRRESTFKDIPSDK